MYNRRIRKNIVQQVATQAGARKDPDPIIVIRGVSSIFQCLPRAFKEEALLWIEQFGFTWRIAKETRIKLIDVVKYRSRSNIVRILKQSRINSSCNHFSIGEFANRADTLLEVVPEGFC